MKKRILAALLATTMCVGLFAGCGEKPSVDTGDAIGITVMVSKGEASLVANPDSPVAKALAEKTGVYVEEIIVAGSGDIDPSKVNLAFAGGDAPDLVNFMYGYPDSLIVYNQLITDEQIVNLREYISDETPNLQKIIQNKKGYGYLNTIIEDGDPIYAVLQGYPESENDLFFEEGWPYWARQDWLDQVGVDAAAVVTADDIYNLMKKFKEEIPDVNGKPIIPATLGENGNSWPQMVKEYCTPWFWANADGTIGTQHYHEYYIKTMEFLAKIFTEGLLDPEAYTQKQDMRDEKVVTGRVGIIHDSISNVVNKYNPQLAANVEGAKFVPLHNALDCSQVDERFVPESGVVYLAAKPESYTVMSASAASDPERAAKIMKFLDYIASEEGQLLVNLGIEGETYETVEGAPAVKQDIYEQLNSDLRSKAQNATGLEVYNWAGNKMPYELTGGNDYNWQYADKDSDAIKFRNLVAKEVREAPYPNVENFVLAMPEFNEVVAKVIYETMTPIQNQALTASSVEEARMYAQKVMDEGTRLGMGEFLDTAAKQFNEFAAKFK